MSNNLNIDEIIVSPEPFVAVPAFQALSYSMSNKYLQDMYANLLASAMIIDTREKVHPAFVEFIKQMTPNDALVIRLISKRKEPVPAATLSIVMNHTGIHILGEAPQKKIIMDLIADINTDILSEEQLRVSLDNLRRLQLISIEAISLSGDALYDFVKHTHLYSEVQKTFEELKNSTPSSNYIHINQKCIVLTPLGDLFCKTCVNSHYA